MKPLDSYQFENISVIKIDTENMEYDVLKGAIETIKKYKPAILIELWSTSEHSRQRFKNNMITPNNVYQTFTFLSELGYICIPIHPESDDFLFIHKNTCTISVNK